MDWIKKRVAGKRMKAQVHRSKKLKSPNEAVEWITNGNTIISDIRMTCSNEWSYVLQLPSVDAGLGYGDGSYTYTETAIREICKKRSGKHELGRRPS